MDEFESSSIQVYRDAKREGANPYELEILAKRAPLTHPIITPHNTSLGRRLSAMRPLK